MYLSKTPFFVPWIYPSLTWHRNRQEKRIYLTFDDGPIPDVTPEILNTLKKFDIRATFFCVGDNIRKHPKLFQSLREQGHQLGNHTYNHLNGHRTDATTYLENVTACERMTQTGLFRPPYGRATKQQYRLLKHQAYEVVMWDVLSGDFDIKLSPQQCLKNVVNHTENGSIIVFHDHIKALPRLKYALPRSIEILLEKGFTFDVL